MIFRRFFSAFLLTVFLLILVPVPQAQAVPQPDLDAQHALLMDVTAGRMLYGKGEHEKAYPASITKVMTALLVLEAVDRGELTLSTPVTAADSAFVNLAEDGSSADIVPGETLTVEQLLYCMLVVSANEAATILAEAVSGTVKDFVTLMNQRAEELGCKDTHFANPNGLHDPKHYTSAWDIYLFTREAMKNETFMTICGSKSYDVPATNKSEARELHSTNALISNWRVLGYIYDYADGIKTGSTDEAGKCLVASALKDGRRLISVTLGCSVKEIGGEEKNMAFIDSAELLDWGYNNFTEQVILTKDELVQEIPVELSKETNAVLVHPANDVSIVLANDIKPEDLERSVTIYNDVAYAPITAGDELGEMTLSYGGEVYATVKLLAADNVKVNHFLQGKHALSVFFSKTVVKILTAVIIIVAVLVYLWVRKVYPNRRYGSRNKGRNGRRSYRGKRR